MQTLNSDDDSAIIALLKNVKTIAVVGLSPKTNRPSYRVARNLQSFSYTIVPVRPAVKEILGEKVYKVLADFPFKPDLVNVFRASQHVDSIVDSCIELGITKIWLQEGVVDHDAQEKAHNAGISLIMNRCIYKEIVRLGIKQNNNV